MAIQSSSDHDAVVPLPRRLHQTKRSRPANSSSEEIPSESPSASAINRNPCKPKALKRLRHISPCLSSSPSASLHVGDDVTKVCNGLAGDGGLFKSRLVCFPDQPIAFADTPLGTIRPAVSSQLALSSRSKNHPDLGVVDSMTNIDSIAGLLSRRGWWTPALLRMFQMTEVSTISLSSSIDHLEDPQPLISVFFSQGCFFRLASLSLSNIYVSSSNLAKLRLLPALTSLDISCCGISTKHLFQLAVHEDTLESLNISGNQGITDDARVLLSALPRLKTLSLRGTSMTIHCLRLLVHAIPAGCRFLSVPQEVMHHLNNRRTKYCVQMPQGYVQDPRLVPNLDVAKLKWNLDLHRRFNKDLPGGGNKLDMINNLMHILSGRLADIRLLNCIGRE